MPEGLPVGIQVIVPFLSDLRVLRLAELGLSEQRKPGLAPDTAKSVRLRRATLVPDCRSG